MKKYKISIVLLMLLSFIIIAISFLLLSDIVPIHFGIDGQPDRYGSKYLMLIYPCISSIIGGAMILVCKYAKVSNNYQKYLLLTGIIIESILLIIELVMIIYASSYIDNQPAFDISKVMMIVMGIMFIVLGNFMPKIEKNRTLGLKTKWSMYNENTWQKSHRFTGFAGVVTGILVLISGIFFKEIVNYIILMSLILVFTLSSTIASYIYYKKEKEIEEQEKE